MKKLLFLAFFAISINLMGQNTPYYNYPEYKKGEFVSSNDIKLPYRMLTPQNMEQGKKYPLVLFMHGAGERGNDNIKQLTHGAGLFTSPDNRENYPAYVLHPQCDTSKYWITESSSRQGLSWEELFGLYPNGTTSVLSVKELVDNIVANNNIDKDRIYIIGLSMGGMATYDMICRYPGFFAAAVPVCGGVDTSRIKDNLGGVKVRIYHGDADSVVPCTLSREAYLAMKKAGVDVTLHEFRGVGHDSWNPAFNTPDFMEWLFSQSN